MPGTTTEYPNWRTRIATPVEALADHPGLKAIAALFGGRRPS